VTVVPDALEGVRVADLSTGLAGPLAAMCLADFGAEVVRVAGGPTDVVWDRGKQIVRDASVDDLLRGADILVVSESDGALGPHARELNPALVVLHVPSWIGEAPWVGGHESDALVSALFGVALRQASFDGGPIDSIYPVLLTIQGVWAAACAVAALIDRERSGHGQTVTVSSEHGAMVAAGAGLTFTRDTLVALAEQPRSRPGAAGGSVPFYRTYRCADGEWLFFAALTPRFTQLGFEALGITDLFADPRLEGRGRAAMLAPEHAPWVIETIAERFATRPRDEWLARLHAAGCPAGAVLDRESWMDHPQVHALEMAVEVDDPTFGTVVMPGVPLKLSATPGRVRGPLLETPSASWDARPAPAGRASAAAGPLEGIRVLDLGAIIAGPFSASLLADLGADVIKVEPLTGDSFRGPGFAAYNKGQRGIALDLRHPDGKATFMDLVRTADVVIDNYRPGVLERLGIDHGSLRQVKPDIISVTITGFGNVGPHGSDAGFDPVLQAMSGMMRAQGGGTTDGSGDWHPVFYTVPVNDVAGSATLALGTMLALFHRGRTGEGQRVTTSLAAMSVLLQTEALTRYASKPPAPLGSRDHAGPGPLQRFYQASDGWFRIDAPDASTDALAAAGITSVDEDAIADWASARKRDDALMQLFAAEIAAAAARTAAEYVDDESFRAHDVLHVDPRPDRDGFTAGRHALFDRTLASGTFVSPRLGEHTREILTEIGYAADRIDELVTSGAAGAAAER
jgi:crotonobetainyl-CoA:carnitine CoA-transferase CaiB-like acyl-CoA transferase